MCTNTATQLLHTHVVILRKQMMMFKYSIAKQLHMQVAMCSNVLSWSAQASVLGKLDVLRNCVVLHVLAVTWCKQRCSMLGVAGVFGVPCVLGVHVIRPRRSTKVYLKLCL